MNVALTLRAVRESAGLARARRESIQTHLDGAIVWLKHAQDVTGNDGVAQTFLVRQHTWAPAYPETTGYIIPTLYRYSALTGDADSAARARRMTDWECEIQLPDGGVLAGALGTSDQPTIFNTGQVLFGWVRAYEVESDERYRTAAARAADWLCKAQDADGCWRRFGSPFTKTSVNLYNTRTAWGLALVHAVTDEPRFLDAAVRNVDWALAQAHRNGWMPNNCLGNDRQPFVHTIAYAMRGFLEVGAYASRADFIDQARRIGDAVLARLPANGSLPGRFDAAWNPTVKWSCLTGNCQMAVNWARLYQLTGDPRYREAVSRVNRFTSSTQRLAGNDAERGGIKGSHPIQGGYHPWQYPNWAAKFFADALMMEMAVTSSANHDRLPKDTAGRYWS